MSSISPRWSLAGVVVCALGLALTAAPALAQPHDDEESSDGIRVYTDDDDDASGDRDVIRVYSDDDDAAPGDRKTIRVYRHGDEETASTGGFLGVRVQDITRELQKAKELPNTEGALISRVESDSPAARAGIKKGDVVLEVDHHQIAESSDLIRRIRDLEPGAKVPVVVFRDGMRKTLTVTLGKRPKEISYYMPRRGPHWVGLADGDLPDLENLGPQLDRIRVYRQDIQRQLADIQEQLTRLREGELQRLEDEIRALREELRALDSKRAPRPD
jgi:membrane-associated protease RseP (regulator of RpoE activity)